MPEKPPRVFRCCFPLLLAGLFSLSFPPAQALAATNISQVFVKDVSFDGETEGGPFFLFGTATLDSHQGSVYVLWGRLIIRGTLDGDVYSLFSHIRVDGQVSGQVLSLSSEVRGEAAVEAATPLIPALAAVPGLIRVSSGVYDDRVPSPVLFTALVLAKLLLFTILYLIRPGFYGQCAAMPYKRPVALLRNGLAVLGLGVLTALLFAMTPLGVFASAAFLLFLLAACQLGEAGLALALGQGLDRFVRHSSSPYANLWVGVILLEAVKQLPAVGTWIRLIAEPALCLGVLSAALWEGCARRRFYQTPYESVRAYDRERLRRVILSGTEKKHGK